MSPVTKLFVWSEDAFTNPISFLAFCFEAVPTLVLCASIKRRVSIAFGIKRLFCAFFFPRFLARGHEGSESDSSLLLKSDSLFKKENTDISISIKNSCKEDSAFNSV